MSGTRLYVVKVKGGGTFLYDTVDVGRFVLKMAEVGDARPFTVKPQRRSDPSRRRLSVLAGRIVSKQEGPS